jgi:hypothetical protein
MLFSALQPSPWSDEQGTDTLESLYGLAESGKEYTVFEMADTYWNDFRDQWLPIGASSGDNQICLCLKEVCRERFGFGITSLIQYSMIQP